MEGLLDDTRPKGPSDVTSNGLKADVWRKSVCDPGRVAHSLDPKQDLRCDSHWLRSMERARYA